MMEEMNSLHKDDTWELIELPKGKKAIGCKWVFAKKQESLNDDIVNYKARVIVKAARSEKILTTMKYSYPL